MSVTDKERHEEALEWNNRGHKKYLNVDFDDAIADYTKAVELWPKLAVAFYNRGTVHYRLGDLQPAVRDLSKAVDLEPDNKVYKEGLEECQRLIKEMQEKPT